jgi:uncharacterized protein
MLIKPVSGSCDLRCRYCFYQNNSGVMPLETLEALTQKALAFADGSCAFLFQGGEPTLAGLPFFETLLAYQKRHNTKHVAISNAIQTNGTRIDRAWAAFLAENDFLVGLSLDGPEALHDQNRRGVDGEGSFRRVMQAAQLLQQAGARLNILCVVSRANAARGGQVYRFFKENGFRHLQFIPCLDPLGARRGSFAWSLTPRSYLAFLKATFDLWYQDRKAGDAPGIRYFDNLLGMVMGQPPEACGMSGVCGCQFVVEADGGVYPCDFYVSDEWKIGNIEEHGFEEMRFSPVCVRFIGESLRLHPDCRACEWGSLCRGGCKRDRGGKPPDGKSAGKNYFCESYRAFFRYALPRLRELAPANRGVAPANRISIPATAPLSPAARPS